MISMESLVEMRERIKANRRKFYWQRAIKWSITSLYILCIVAIAVNISEFGILTCIDFITAIRIRYLDQMKSISLGEPFWSSDREPLSGGAFVFVQVILLLASIVFDYLIDKPSECFKYYMKDRLDNAVILKF